MRRSGRAMVVRILGIVTLAIVTSAGGMGCGDDSCTCPDPPSPVERIMGTITGDLYYLGDDVHIYFSSAIAGSEWDGGAVQLWIFEERELENDAWVQITSFDLVYRPAEEGFSATLYLFFPDPAHRFEDCPYVIIIIR